MNHQPKDENEQEDGLKLCGQPAIVSYLNGHAQPVNACFAHAQRERSLHMAKQMRLPLDEREDFIVYERPTEEGALCECIVAVGKPAERRRVPFRNEFNG